MDEISKLIDKYTRILKGANRALIETGEIDEKLAHTESIKEYEIILDAIREKQEREKRMQWLDNMENPMEPLKIQAALRSEMMKMELRKARKPKDISLLDYTIIAVLVDALRRGLEGAELDEQAD